MNSPFDWAAFRYLITTKLWGDVWFEINDDNVWGLAAQQSYYFLLAFFPFLIFVTAVVSFIPIDPHLLGRILGWLYRLLPESAYLMVRHILLTLANSQDKGILSFGLAMTLWASSRAMAGMVGVLNTAYEVKETRSFVRVQVLALVVTFLVSLFVVISVVLLFFGDSLINLFLSVRFLGPYYAIRSSLRTLYSVVRWAAIFIFLNIGIQLLYYVLPARRLPWKFISPGSAVATLGWIGVSQGFKLYVNHFTSYQRLYGSLGALIVLMVWFYLSSFLLLTGGEIDSEIYRQRREKRRVDY